MKKDKSQQLIVFDVDGVLLDVTASYREVVRQTARAFFQPAAGFMELPDPLFSLTELAALKQSGGLNNDWDLTYFILQLLFTRVKCPSSAQAAESGWSGYRKALGRCNVSGLGEFLKTQMSPLSTLLGSYQAPGDGFIRTLSELDVAAGNVVKQIFQEFYLGSDLFGATYGIRPQVYSGEGYIHRERLLIDKSLLERLASRHILAIATGRPKSEADFALNHHAIGSYFDTVLTLEDCIQEEQRILKQEGRQLSLSKPEPFMLDAIAATIKPRPVIAYYLGDMPDDMLAAARSRTGYLGIGFVSAAPDRQVLRRALLRAGADYIIEDLNELEQIVAV